MLRSEPSGDGYLRGGDGYLRGGGGPSAMSLLKSMSKLAADIMPSGGGRWSGMRADGGGGIGGMNIGGIIEASGGMNGAGGMK